VTKLSQVWDTRNIELDVGDPSKSFVSNEQIKKYEERDKNMVKVKTQLDLLIKHVMGVPPKAVNFIASKSISSYDDDDMKSFYEEIWFMLKKIEGSCLLIKGKASIKVGRKEIINGKTVHGWNMIGIEISEIRNVIERLTRMRKIDTMISAFLHMIK